MLGKIEFWSINSLIWFLAGMAVLWIIQNGWGKALAIYHARANKAQADAKNLYAEVQGQLDSLLAPIKTDVAMLKEDVAALKNKQAA